LTVLDGKPSFRQMINNNSSLQASVPSVDRVLNLPAVAALIDAHGRKSVTQEVRSALSTLRKSIAEKGDAALVEAGDEALVENIAFMLEKAARPSLRAVYNLTGTVIHTNLGRSQLPQEAIDAMVAVAGGPANLEFDVAAGKRGERDSHLEALLCELTGAEAATVVNNNAAAVLLVLNALALGKEVPVSRGELIEIGGAFRMPDIMSRAGCKLVEIGTTNRTHLKDYAEALKSKTALLMKVHTSNYVVQGFTKVVPEKEIAQLAHENKLPFVVDLGSGTLVDLGLFGLPYERTPSDTIQDGADIVTFSGDKLLGGPQAGIIVGKKDLIDKIRKNPMKRAMRLDKITIAALAAVLRLYRNPDTLVEKVPTLRHLARATDEVDAIASRLREPLSKIFEGTAEVSIEKCQSQIGSGSLPIERLKSSAVAIAPKSSRKGEGALLKKIATEFRKLPVPVIGRIQDGAFLMDVRCLDDEAGFIRQLNKLQLK
jgi:L-seryl-tRNA(Ser) seleniumtransferase